MSAPPQSTKNTLPLGWYVLGGIAAVAAADTEIGPLVLAFLGAAVVYNAKSLLGTKSNTTTPAPNLGGGGGGHDLAV